MSNVDATMDKVPQGRLKTPFHSRLAKLDTLNTWHEWKGYSSADALYCADMEYFAIRNATAVFDLTPMTKYRITGPDSLAYLNRLVTRDKLAAAGGDTDAIDDPVVMDEYDRILAHLERHGRIDLPGMRPAGTPRLHYVRAGRLGFE